MKKNQVNDRKVRIFYTHTDEAPALATASLLPIFKAFLGKGGISLEVKDISLAGRILACFPEAQKISPPVDHLSDLVQRVQEPHTYIIKLPNISASIPQLKEAIGELQSQGYSVPNYPDSPLDPLASVYSKVLGSAVNPVLREGNSDRRVASSVKRYAQKNPHTMGVWERDSQTHVAHMEEGDFYGSEKALTLSKKTSFKIEFVNLKGDRRILKKPSPLYQGEIVDCSVMSCQFLKDFLIRQMEEAKDSQVLFSLHLKATMMKVSDPIIFGYALETFFKTTFSKYEETFSKLGIKARYGLSDLLYRLQSLPSQKASEIKSQLEEDLKFGPSLAMVQSDQGITNFHVPSDVIIDASMATALRSSGKMWNSQGELQDIKAVIPDRSYASIYQATIDFCKENGAFDVSTMGHVANVGLMAQKAQEYGSHDKTFCLEERGRVQVVDCETQQVLMEQFVEPGDIFRMCQTKEEAVKDWVHLALERVEATGTPAFFWLDKERSHDREILKKVEGELKLWTGDLSQIQIQSPKLAIESTLKRLKEGKDTISVTGNVLRDYLTDLFPVLELGTSAKMLSIVPLMSGGKLFETGAGGSAPKHMDQFVRENHLRWDSLGEFMAMATALESIGSQGNNLKASVLGQTLDQANGEILNQNKSPRRGVGELDNRDSHFYLALYWSGFLARQTRDKEFQDIFGPLHEELKDKEGGILKENQQVQGQRVDLGGYYHPQDLKRSQLMRPSLEFKAIIDHF